MQALTSVVWQPSSEFGSSFPEPAAMAAERVRCAASRTRGCAAAATLHNSHPNSVGPAPNGTVAAHNKQVRVQRPHRWAQDEDGTIRFPRTTRPENRQRLL